MLDFRLGSTADVTLLNFKSALPPKAYIPALATVLPIEKLPLTRVLIRVRNRPLQERHRTGLSREQMSLWLAGYPKTLGFDVRFGSTTDIVVS